MFDMKSHAKEKEDISILFDGFEYGMCKDFYKWMGWDILFNAATKTAKALPKSFGNLSLSFVKIPDEAVVNTQEVLSQFGDASFIKWKKIYPNVPNHLIAILSHNLVALARRAEPCGIEGLAPMCAGMPTLVSDRSQLASIIRGLTDDWEQFTGIASKLTAKILNFMSPNPSIRK